MIPSTSSQVAQKIYSHTHTHKYILHRENANQIGKYVKFW